MCVYQQERHIKCAKLCDGDTGREGGKEKVKVETLEFSFEPVIFEKTVRFLCGDVQ